MPRPQTLRVYEILRSAHLERAEWVNSSTVLYRRPSYDLDPELLSAAGESVRQVGLRTILKILVSVPAQVVEVNEPLMLASWRLLFAIALAQTIRRMLLKQPHQLVSYAIENLDQQAVLGQRIGPVGRQVGPMMLRLVAAALVRAQSRIVFGTQGAEQNYRASVPAWPRRTSTTLTPALPAPCQCPTHPRDPNGFLFVGALEERKGVEQMLSAWDALRQQGSQMRLTIVGSGPLVRRVREWASERSDVAVLSNLPRPAIHELYRRARTVILLSQRTPNWREQIGLPILEGLSHGCEIVTTTETGIADWLVERDHMVVTPEAGADITAGALLESFERPIRSQEILHSLPVLDGRIVADRELVKR